MKLSSKTLEAASSKMASVVFNKKLDRIYEQRMKLISELVKKLAAEKDSIKDIEICVDDRIKFCKEGAGFPIDGLAAATGIATKQIAF